MFAQLNWMFVTVGCVPEPPALVQGPPPEDSDGDGFATSLDCDDENALVHPGADEICDGVDNDCDQSIDEDAVDAGQYWADADGDGYGDDTLPLESCSQPPDTADQPGDCDDANASLHPQTVWYRDQDLDGFGGPETGTGCLQPTGTVAASGDCDDGEATVHPDAPELCDYIDNNCDGTIDETGPNAQTFYADADHDGFGDAIASLEACWPPSGHVTNDWDCDDTDIDVRPGGQEICGNSVDEDCTGSLDNGCVSLTPDDALRWTGEAPGNLFGTVVAAIGDMNADGCDDVAFGAPSNAHGAVMTGAVYVVRGRPAIAPGVVDLVSDSVAIIRGDDFFDTVGRNVAGPGDLNGDGIPDVYVGSGYEDWLACSECPDVRVYFGPVVGELGPPDADLWLPFPASFGNSLNSAAAGDIGGDGRTDLAIGSSSVSVTGAADEGLVRFYEGPLSGELSVYAPAQFVGPGGSWSGMGLSDIRDANGDGLGDLWIGSPGGGIGRAYLLTGPMVGTLAAPDATATVHGEGSSGYFGGTVQFGDLNNDGHLDAVASDTLVDKSGLGEEAGAVYVLYGPVTGDRFASHADATVEGEGERHNTGTALAVADVDGDGSDDLVVGGPGWEADISVLDTGTVGLFYGPMFGPRWQTSAEWIFEGIDPWARMAVDAAVLDFNGDGDRDILIGGFGYGGSGLVTLYDGVGF